MNISGGQKARISLARAIYANYDIYLLDDILSAVDVGLSDFLMKETINKFLKEKTVILVTNCLKYAKLSD
jgi:ABC-type transport system involved in cytochrome bd biosynthesis fused ATPase/permease subunit